MRDFTAMVRNKVRRSRQRVGYLPVEQVEEGQPLEQTETTPQNANSEIMHQRMLMFAQRLDQRLQEAVNADGTAGELLANANEEKPSVQGKSVSMGTIHFSNENNEENVPEVGTNGNLKGELKLHSRQQSDGTAPPSGRSHPGIKSPSQLMAQVDQMHKEELDQLLQKLQFENLELKHAMEQKRREAMQFLPNKSAPNLHHQQTNSNEDAERSEFAQQQHQLQQQQQMLRNREPKVNGPYSRAGYNAAAGTQHQNFSPQLHPKFLHQQLQNQQQQMYPTGIYASAQTVGESVDGGIYSNGFARTYTDMAGPQMVRQLTPSLLNSSRAVVDPQKGAPIQPPPTWQQKMGMSMPPPAVPRHRTPFDPSLNASTVPPQTATTNLDDLADQQVLLGARNLRLHQQRLEQRSRVLDEQNRQVRQQLERLNRMRDMSLPGGSEAAYLNQAGISYQQNVSPNEMVNWTIPRTAAFNALGKHLGCPPTSTNPQMPTLSSADECEGYDSGAGGMNHVAPPVGGVRGLQATENRKNGMDRLRSTADELSRAIESLVVSVVVRTEEQTSDFIENTEDEEDQETPANNHNGFPKEENNNTRNGPVKI